MPYRVPEQINREDYVAAMTQLLDLIGVTPNEVMPPITLENSIMSMWVVARAEGDESSFPSGFVGADAPQQFSELGYHVAVAVTD